MIFGLLIIALVLISTGLRGTEHELGDRLSKDFLGAQGFLTWVLAMLGIGAIGYLPGMRNTSRYLLLLVLAVIVLRNGGVWANLQSALQTASAAGPEPAVALPASNASSGTANTVTGASGGGSSSSSDVSTGVNIAADIAKVAALFG